MCFNCPSSVGPIVSNISGEMLSCIWAELISQSVTLSVDGAVRPVHVRHDSGIIISYIIINQHLSFTEHIKVLYTMLINIQMPFVNLSHVILIF